MKLSASRFHHKSGVNARFQTDLKKGRLTSSHRFYKWKGAATGAFPFRYLLSVGLPAVSLFFVGLRRIFFNVFHILHASALRLSDFCYENLFTFINRSRRLHPAAELFSGSALCCLHSLAETPFIRAFQPKFALNPTPQDDRANQHNGCEENPSNQRQEKMIKPITMAIAASPTSRLKSGLPPGCGKMNIGIRPISFGSSLGSVGSSMLNLLLEKYIDPQNKSAWRCFYYMGTRSVLPCVIMQAIVSTLLNENGHEKTRASLRSVKIIDFSKSVPAA